MGIFYQGIFKHCLERMVFYMHKLKEQCQDQDQKKKEKQFLMQRLLVYKHCLQILKESQMYDLVDLRLFATFVEIEFSELKNQIYPLLSLLKKYLTRDEQVEDPSYLKVLYKNLKNQYTKIRSNSALSQTLISQKQQSDENIMSSPHQTISDPVIRPASESVRNKPQSEIDLKQQISALQQSGTLSNEQIIEVKTKGKSSLRYQPSNALNTIDYDPSLNSSNNQKNSNLYFSKRKLSFQSKRECSTRKQKNKGDIMKRQSLDNYMNYITKKFKFDDSSITMQNQPKLQQSNTMNQRITQSSPQKSIRTHLRERQLGMLQKETNLQIYFRNLNQELSLIDRFKEGLA
ncbi:UNKNOWN [Stylonychia lemnae]|uniref:Uncharacterized protein n=1 Tax=Stylonychia lemnae TaxID=5949 RepID=A0A078AAJ8_STYLE|nr:UNKNOWN [Stylonychia lemnae]|eukprot:CDW79239.1 UNKNOWN [Stylonychia lemnae]